MQKKNYLAIDYGTKFTGIAIYRHQEDPYPLGLLRLSTSTKDFLPSLVKIIREEEIHFLVLGIPYYADGKSNHMTKKVLQFKTDLIRFLESQSSSSGQNVQVIEQDETLSTFEAEQRMKSSPLYQFKIDINKIDILSAQIILEDFLKLHPQSPLK
ncbi:MAG: Holliday junction resolvase RuvX [Bacteriovoracaceae bacterium]|nr:Holliday junction resolvase RuvX [Bacteriovoracaceae bacterium]